MATHTHTGTCQVCGRQQAAKNNGGRTIAKHGYTVEFGWFTGVCAGSGAQALEISDAFAREFAAKLVADATDLRAFVARLNKGEIDPVRCARLDRWGSKVYAPRERRYGLPSTREVVTVDYADATPAEQSAARIALRIEKLQRAAAYDAYSLEIIARIPKVLGQPLTPVAVEPPVVQIKAGDRFNYGGSVWVVKNFHYSQRSRNPRLVVGASREGALDKYVGEFQPHQVRKSLIDGGVAA